jgi:two-component system chemotaxis response regulator CheY
MGSFSPTQTGDSGENMGRKVIVIDDSDTVRDQVGATLRRAGYEVAEATDGQEGVDLIERTPDAALVICDVNMPRKNGIELLEDLQKRGTARTVPILMLTTEGRPDLIERARKCGAKGWLVKPVKSDLILAVVAKLAP